MRSTLAVLCVACFAAAGPEPGKEEVAALVKRLASRDREDRLAAVHDAAAVQAAALVTPLTRLLKAKDPEVRLAAIDALAARTETKAQKKAAPAVVRRLQAIEGKEGHDGEIEKLLEALHDLAQKTTIKPILSGIDLDTSREELNDRLMAIANVPDASAIEALIGFASSGRKHGRARRDSTRKALRYATGEDMRGDVEAWRRWWSANKKKFDFVMAAHEREQKRAEAAEKKKKREERRKKKEERKKKGKGKKKEDAN